MTKNGGGRNVMLTRRRVLQAFSTAIAASSAVEAASRLNTFESDAREPDWVELKRQFLLQSGLVHLNAGSLGACPRSVLNARQEAELALESNPAVLGYGAMFERADAVRASVASFLGCEVDEIALTHNTTDGMNLVAEGCDLREGDHILTTDHEHSGGVLCWETMAKRRGAILDRVALSAAPRDEDEILSRFEAALTRQTKIISVSHVTYTTGLKLPIARLSELLRPRGCLLIVDGAQAVGSIPVNVRDLGCDAYATSGHKWLLGPKGTGLLYIRRESRERIAPLRLSAGSAAYTGATGVQDLPALIGLGAALDWLNSLGRGAVQKRLWELRRMIVTALEGLSGVRIVSPTPESGLATPIVSLHLPNHAGATVIERLLKRHDVCVKSVGRPSIDIRISPHVYNSPEDVDRLAEALRSEMQS